MAGIWAVVVVLSVSVLGVITLIGLGAEVRWQSLIRGAVIASMLLALGWVTVLPPMVQIRREPVGKEESFKDEPVIKQLGHQVPIVKPDPYYIFRVDVAQQRAEYALIIAIAAFLLQVLPRAKAASARARDEKPASSTAFREPGPDMFGKES